MLYPLIKKLNAAPVPEHLLALEQAETLFHYERFEGAEALELGNAIVTTARSHGGELAVQILRLTDELTLFQYVGEGKDRRNLDFAMRKGVTAAVSGHCSLWPLLNAALTDRDDYGLESREDCLPVGGAFPIYKNNQLIAVVMVSGFREGLDHIVLVEARCQLVGCEIPAYYGPLL